MKIFEPTCIQFIHRSFFFSFNKKQLCKPNSFVRRHFDFSIQDILTAQLDRVYFESLKFDSKISETQSQTGHPSVDKNYLQSESEKFISANVPQKCEQYNH